MTALRDVAGFPPVAFHTAERKAKSGAPSRGAEHPGALYPGRLMSQVLIVAAGKFRDPVVFLVEVVANDGLLHGASAYRRSGGDL